MSIFVWHVGPFTIFAPDNHAFSLLGNATLNSLKADTAKLADILKYHVVSGLYHVKPDLLVNELMLDSLKGDKLRVNYYYAAQVSILYKTKTILSCQQVLLYFVFVVYPVLINSTHSLSRGHELHTQTRWHLMESFIGSKKCSCPLLETL